MLKLILPVLLAALGTGSGIAAAVILAPEPETAHAEPMGPCGPEQEHAAAAGDTHSAAPPSENDFIKLGNQFVVPVVRDERVTSLVIVSLSLEITPESRDLVLSREPKLRDVVLQSMFDHANRGGFDGYFTGSDQLDTLRHGLYKDGVAVLGHALQGVLIVEIARQDA